MKTYTKSILFFFLLYAYLISCIIFPPSEAYGGEYGFKRLIPQLISMSIIIFCSPCIFKIPLSPFKTIKKFYIFGGYTTLSFFIFLLEKEFSLIFFAEVFKILIWILPIYYLFNIFNHLNDDIIKKFIKLYIIINIAYLIIGIGQEYAFRSKGIYESLNIEQGVYVGGSIFYIMPLVFAVFPKRTATFIYVLGFGIAIMTAKRTPIILLLIFILFHFKEMLRSLKLKDYLIICSIILVSFSFFLTKYWDMLIVRNSSEIANGTYGSGRDSFYKIILEDFFFNNNPLNFFFGHGFGSVHQLLLHKYGIAISAHNGFLDCIYVYGVIGLIIYLSIFYNLWKDRVIIKKYTTLYSCYISFIILWFSQNMIIHGFAGPNIMPYGIFLAYVYSKAYKQLKFKSNGTGCINYNCKHE